MVKSKNGFPSRSSLRLGGRREHVRLRQGYGATAFALDFGRERRLGLTGLEPVTLRLSSACSNQLSYRPGLAAEPPDFRFAIVDFRFGTTGAQARIYLNRQSQIANRKFVAAES